MYPEHTNIEYSDHEWEEGGAIPYKSAIKINGCWFWPHLGCLGQNVNIILTHNGIAWD